VLTENEVLLARIAELTVQIAEATERDRQLLLELELKVLRQRLAQNATETYGSRSERRTRGTDRKKKAKGKQRGHGPTPQPNLPIQEHIACLAEADCTCASCGSDLRVMAEQFEESELVASVQRKFVLRHIKRQKYACKGCGAIRTAPGPLRLIPGGRYDLTFAVQVALDKYLDALPLERQVLRMKRRGLQVTSQTLWDQLHAMYLVLLPSFLALQARVLSDGVLHIDETPWRQMGKGPSKRWWLWTVVSAAGVLFDLQPSRGSDAARALLNGFAGVLVADGYAVYASLEKAFSRSGQQLAIHGDALPQPDFTLAMCWMHARRPLFKAAKNGPEPDDALDLIDELYAVETLAKQRAAGDPAALLEHRRRLRDERSRDIVRRLELWAAAQRPLPKTQFHKGVEFLKARWPSLKVFLDDPRVPLDNGEAERQIRRPVLGRKNFYGTRSERGARVASVMFSLIGTCTLLDVDPFEFLTEAIERGLRNPGSVYLPHDHPTNSSQSRVND
jgi:transposase